MPNNASAAAEVIVTVDGEQFSYSLSWEEVASLFASGKLRKTGQTRSTAARRARKRTAKRTTTRRVSKATTNARRRTKTTSRRVRAAKKTPFRDVRAWAKQPEGKSALKAAGLDPSRLDGVVVGNLANKYRAVYDQHG